MSPLHLMRTSAPPCWYSRPRTETGSRVDRIRGDRRPQIRSPRADGPRAATPESSISLNALLQARQLTKLYGEQIALMDVAFDVHEGEVLGIIGPNGSGKTTLLECVTGLQPADDGQVRWLGSRSRAADAEERSHEMGHT